LLCFCGYSVSCLGVKNKSSKCSSMYSLRDLLFFRASWSILSIMRFERAMLTGRFCIILV